MLQQALDRLIQLLTLEKIESNLFKGRCEDLGLPQVFGGQIVAQALRAGMESVDTLYKLHSCHTYFLQPGDSKQDIFYHVDIMREGKYFIMLNVTAMQNNLSICCVMLSFHLKEEGFEHQDKMPNAESPETFISESDLLKELGSVLPSPFKEKFTLEQRPFDVRLKYVNDPFQGKVLPPEQLIWVKVNGKMMDNQRLQQCLLAYFSDFHCLMTSLHPHKKGFLQKGVKLASLDHSIWFHRDIDLNNWLLYMLKSSNAFAGRALVSGQFFDRNGKLLATVQQEGLVRFES